MISNLFASIYKIWPFLVLFFGAFFIKKKKLFLWGSLICFYLFIFSFRFNCSRKSCIFCNKQVKKSFELGFMTCEFQNQKLSPERNKSLMPSTAHLNRWKNFWLFYCPFGQGGIIFVSRRFFLLHWVEIKKKGWRSRVLWVYGNCSMDGFFYWSSRLGGWLQNGRAFFSMSGFSARHLSSGVNPLPVDCHD